MSTPSSNSAARRTLFGALPLLAALAACGPRSGNTQVGDFDPAGAGKIADGPFGFFINDANEGGLASNFLIEGLYWGRLVDVYDEDSGGVQTRIFEDFLIDQGLANTDDVDNDGIFDGFDYDLDGTVDFFLGQDPLTAEARLTVKHPLVATGVAPNRVVDEAASADFLAAIKYLNDTANLDRIVDKGLSSSALPPFSFVARNAALIVRMNDLVDEGSISPETVKVFTGIPPAKPFEARILADHNHGAIDGSTFHTTRVVIDFTVTPSEASSTSAPVNTLGLPPSTSVNKANVGIKIPRVPVQEIGQFFVLRNSKGKALALVGNGSQNVNSQTLDIERAMRSGGSTQITGDPFNGFLPDTIRPSLLTRQPIQVLSSPAPVPVAPGSLPPALMGLENVWQISWVYNQTACAITPLPGDKVVFAALPTIQPAVVEVLEVNPAPVGGLVSDVFVQLEANDSGAVPVAGSARFVTTYDGSPGLQTFLRCFVTVTPTPGLPPDAKLSPLSNFVVEFDEPMDPDSLAPFDSFFVSNRRDPGADPLSAADDTYLPPTRPWHKLPGTIIPSQDFKSFTFDPVLPLSHQEDTAETYFLNLVTSNTGVRDLAGNGIGVFVDPIPFAVDPDRPTDRTGGYVLTFDSFDEDGNSGMVTPPPAVGPPFFRDRPEIRGNIVYDTVLGTIAPRPVNRFSYQIERVNGDPDNLQNIMPFYPGHPSLPGASPYDNGIHDPFIPFGSRVMTVWRYADMGFKVNDEASYDIDVEGLSWSTQLAGTFAEIYPHFQISLSHSAFLPDEGVASGFLEFPFSGLVSTGWTDNVLQDPFNKLKIVHPGFRGYIIDPSQAFLTEEENLMQPFPLNRGIPDSQKIYYTWRDTSILAVGADGSLGTTSGPPDPMGNPGPAEPSGLDILAFANTGSTNVVSGYGLTPTPQASIAKAPFVPSIGMPLLMDFQVNPSDAIGMNVLDHGDPFALGVPVFRIHSSGGFDPAGNEIIKIPSLQDMPTGGFNTVALAGALGAPTPGADSIMYMGQVDFVIRVSRAHTVWIMVHGSIAEELDSSASGDAEGNATFEPAIVEYLGGDLPPGTKVILEYRGGSTSDTVPPSSAFGEAKGVEFVWRNALFLDAYGDEPSSLAYTLNTDGTPEDNPLYLDMPSNKNPSIAFDGGSTWKPFIDDVDGSQFFQVRLTFVNEISTGSSAVVSGLAFAWDLAD